MIKGCKSKEFNYIFENDKLIIKFKIANINLCINGLSKIKLCSNVWTRFLNNNSIQENIIINIISRKSIDYQIESYHVSKCYEQVFRYKSEVFLANNEMSECTILSCRDMANFMILLNHIFYANAIRQNIVQFHSSLVQWQNHGIMFIGPSGIGKTTQAELWQRYQNADIINGDLVFIQKKEEEFLGWGSPWHGSSPYCLNQSVPVNAIIVLKQGAENKIRKLNGLEMVSEVGKNLFYPKWVDKGMEMALDILDQLLQRIPVYELTNKADEDSVLMVKQVVFDEKN